MGKKKKPRGFNTPFADLKVQVPPKEKPADIKARAKEANKRFPVATSSPDTPFAELMSDVVPMGDANRVVPPVRSRAETPAPIGGEDDEALALNEFFNLVQSPKETRLTLHTDPDGNPWGSSVGVNKQLIKQLQRGEIPPRRTLDLHGLTKKDAFLALKNFIRQARLDGEYCVLVITGKGQGSAEGLGILKEAVPGWLAKNPNNGHLLGFCTARPSHGGEGALYVLLRKFP